MFICNMSTPNDSLSLYTDNGHFLNSLFTGCSIVELVIVFLSYTFDGSFSFKDGTDEFCEFLFTWS